MSGGRRRERTAEIGICLRRIEPGQRQSIDARESSSLAGDSGSSRPQGAMTAATQKRTRRRRHDVSFSSFLLRAAIWRLSAPLPAPPPDESESSARPAETFISRLSSITGCLSSLTWRLRTSCKSTTVARKGSGTGAKHHTTATCGAAGANSAGGGASDIVGSGIVTAAAILSFVFYYLQNKNPAAVDSSTRIRNVPEN
jgi:hypothetical protein